MKITEKGFELLKYLEGAKGKRLSQKFLAEELGFSVGMVNSLLRTFDKSGFVTMEGETSITSKGIEALEPFRVKRAVILAAGVSERLMPVSLSVPKPLVTINGKRIVDTIIDALLQNDIEDITVVVGYKKEMFSKLKDKYPDIKFVENPLYNQSGNITTLASAIDSLENCYICDADLYIHNTEVISKYEFNSCFFALPVRKTDDWRLVLNGKKVASLSLGGERCYKTIFITYLNSSAGQRCKKDIEEALNKRGGKEHRWFDILNKKYDIDVKECFSDDISEIDTMDDLIKLDKSYLSIQI